MILNNPISFLRADSTAPDFVLLVAQLDADLARRDGSDHAFYSQFNKIDHINYVIIAYDRNTPVAIGAIKHLEEGIMEVKRMFTAPEFRGQSIAKRLLTLLEEWAAELGYRKCVLETGKRQPEAIALYLANGYRSIENYGQYKGVENSVCFEKLLIN